MNVKIENYRGIDIEFNTQNETFTCLIDELNRKEKKSYASIKKEIDDYKSKNKDFKAFEVINDPSKSFGGIINGRVVKVVGIRKDGRFVYENEKGEKEQISEYNEKDVILYNPEMEKQLVEIAYLETLVDDARKKVEQAKKMVKGTTLAEYKKTLLL